MWKSFLAIVICLASNQCVSNYKYSQPISAQKCAYPQAMQTTLWEHRVKCNRQNKKNCTKLHRKRVVQLLHFSRFIALLKRELKGTFGYNMNWERVNSVGTYFSSQEKHLEEIMYANHGIWLILMKKVPVQFAIGFALSQEKRNASTFSANAKLLGC